MNIKGKDEILNKLFWKLQKSSNILIFRYLLDSLILFCIKLNKLYIEINDEEDSSIRVSKQRHNQMLRDYVPNLI